MTCSENKFWEIIDKLDPVIVELEEGRKKYFWKISLIGIFIGIILILFFKVLIIVFSFLNFNLFNCILGCLLAFLFLSIKFEDDLRLFKAFILRDYIKSFKENIIKVIFEELYKENFKSFLYKAKGFISLNEFLDSALFTEYITNKNQLKIYGDDFVEIKTSDSKIKFSELHIKNQYKKSKHDPINVFNGLFFVIEFQESFNCCFGTSISLGSEEIIFDNAEFNELFKVYADDITQAFRIFSPKILENLSSFVKNKNITLDFSFINNKLYFTIGRFSKFAKVSLNCNFFEAPLFKSLLDNSIYEEYYKTFQLIIDVIEELKSLKN